MTDSVQCVVSLDSLQKAQSYLIQFLKDNGYTGSLDDGTAIFDVVIKPMSLLLLLFQQDIEKSKAYLSLADAQALKDDLGDEYDTVIDSLLSNFFMTRKSGTSARAVLRLYFSKALDFLSILEGVKVASYSNVGLTATQQYSFYPEDFTVLVGTGNDATMYYVDVEVESETALELPEAVSEALSITGSVSSIYFLKTELVRIANTGSVIEESDAFIARSEKALTTRELITDRAFFTVLQNEFAAVTSVYTAGYGDPEQVRDIVDFESISVHVGNKVDVFIQSGIGVCTEEFICSDSSLATLQGKAVLQIIDVQDATGTSLSWDVHSYTHEEAASLRDELVLSVPTASEEDVLTIQYLASSALADVSAFVEDAEQRVSCCDTLIKEKFPVVINLDLQVCTSADAFVLNDSATVSDTLKNGVVVYIKNCDPVDGFSLSALISYLHNNYEYIKEVVTPVTATYSLVDPSEFSVTAGTITSKFSVPPNLSDQFTDSTLQFYTTVGNINVTWAD